MSTSLSTRSGRPRRRASVYLAVLSIAMIVTVIGLSALTAVRVQHRGAEGTSDLAEAALYAQAAIELGMHRIENDPDWRTANGEGFWAIDQPIGDGKLSVEANDLGTSQQLESSSDSDSVLLTGTGFKGDARYKLQVTLVAELNPLSCLEASMHAGNDVMFNGATVNGDQIISANDGVIASSADVYPDVEAVNTISGGMFRGTQTPGIEPRTMPDPATVFDYYVANGTPISIWSLPKWDEAGQAYDDVKGIPAIRWKVISPLSNPFGGSTNPEGVYVIDCEGQTLLIEDSRIVGTLVLTNPNSASVVKESVNWEPAVANYPSLLVSGAITIAITATSLSESATGTNFNPSGTPYEGEDDSDTDDTYPSVIKGLTYVSGDLSTQNYVAIDGVLVVGNSLTATHTLDLTYQQTFFDNPPPGFSDPPTMVISPGSWKQVVD